MATMTNDASNGILNQGFSAGSNGKSVLKEAVDAVLKSFAKHTQGHGGGRSYFWHVFYYFRLMFIKTKQPDKP